MRVLVTGADGMVGSAVAARLRETGHEVTELCGDARDPSTVVPGVDAVAHLAAFPHPYDRPAPEVFGNNTLATFTVLWTAAEQGARRFVIASSVNATGLHMNPEHPLPPRYPIDETIPPDIADPYSLSKQVDEQTLRAVCRRFGGSGAALRLPLMVPAAEHDQMRDWYAGHLAETAGEGWGWLDTRAGAEAFRLALTAGYRGVHVLQLAARETFVDMPTEELLDRYAAGVPRPRFPGRTAPIDTRRARDLLGFEA